MKGIHHITAITASPARNINFYEKILGLRLIKLTVNQDDPFAYHLYYGDGIGTPGTILTFFDFGDIPKGVIGPGQVSRIFFAVPNGSLEFWKKRLSANSIKGSNGLHFDDPDGMPLGFKEKERKEVTSWKQGPVPEQYAITGFSGIVMCLEESSESSNLLGNIMEFEKKDGNFITPDGSSVTMECLPDAPAGFAGSGSVHHVAWRAKTEDDHKKWRDKLVAKKFNVTPIIDRIYFKSIYFREPGGILFEVATDGPGFIVDEPLESLGKKLVLPPWLESERKTIEKNLPDLKR